MFILLDALCGHRFSAFQFARYQRVEEDRREYERIPIGFPVTFSDESIDGKGSVVDLSMSGCTFHADNQPVQDKILRVVLHVSNDVLPIGVEAAVVRSVQRDRVGLEFLRFEHGERERLQLFIRGLLRGSRNVTVSSPAHPVQVHTNEGRLSR